MKTMFCWRCGMDVPMMDEKEYSIISELYSQAFRPGRGIGESRFELVLQRYNEWTGFGETSVGAIMHHRISLYGEPCMCCGKPLRSPSATFCAACGKPTFTR